MLPFSSWAMQQWAMRLSFEIRHGRLDSQHSYLQFGGKEAASFLKLLSFQFLFCKMGILPTLQSYCEEAVKLVMLLEKGSCLINGWYAVVCRLFSIVSNTKFQSLYFVMQKTQPF